MIRHTPCEYFLKYLIVLPDAFDNDAIKAKLFDYGLDDLGAYYIERLRKKLHPPKPFYPTDAHHARSRNFLIKEGLWELFDPTRDADRVTAFRILEKTRIKEYVEAMLIAHTPFHAISDSLTRHRKFKADETAIELFHHFFWNMELVDSVEVRALIQLRASATSPTPDADLLRQNDAFKRAAWNDPRRSAAELPHAPISAIMAQVRMGVMPARVELSKILGSAMEVAGLTLFEAICINGPQDHIKARNLSEVSRQIREVLETLVKPEDDVREQFSQLVLRTSDKKVPSIHALSRGQHTVDMLPPVEDVHVTGDAPGPSEPGDPSDAEPGPGPAPPKPAPSVPSGK